MKKKIILTSNAYAPSIGGIENSLRHLADEAHINGDEVEVIVSDIGTDSYINEEVIDGVLIKRYQLKPYGFFMASIVNFIVSNIALFKLFKSSYREDPNSIVIARFHIPALLAKMAGFKNVIYLVPSIIEFQCRAELNSLKIGKRKIFLYFWMKINSSIQRLALIKSKVFLFSNSMLNQCHKLVNDDSMEYRITKPGVDHKRFYPIYNNELLEMRKKLNLPLDVPIILFVGRFVKAKGVDLLIDAFSELNLPAHLVLVGGGSEGENFKDKIRKKSLNSDVTIVPPCKGVEDYYRSANVFVMSSNYEPLGQTILEGFMSGLTVVAFKKSETVETATQELGMDDSIYYAPEHSSKSLSKALKSAIETPKVKSTIHKKAKIKFSWASLYSELIENK